MAKIEFLISGTPREGPRISDVHTKLRAFLVKTVAEWEKKVKERVWQTPSDAVRCVETRILRLNKTNAPVHGDSEHETACPTCTKSGRLCMLIQRRSTPVILLPLAEGVREPGAAPETIGYYIAKKKNGKYLL